MRPSLIHPQKIKIELSVRVEDAILREPVGRAKQRTITVFGQCNFRKAGAEDGVETRRGFLLGRAIGYLVVRDTAMNRLIKKGAKIVTVNGRSVSWVVVDIVPSAHYIGEHNLLYIPFEESGA